MTNNFSKTVKKLTNYIKSIPFLNLSFYVNNKNRKYNTEISFRESIYFYNKLINIHWNTIYTFYKKLIKLKIIETIQKIQLY